MNTELLKLLYEYDFSSISNDERITDLLAENFALAGRVKALENAVFTTLSLLSKEEASSLKKDYMLKSDECAVELLASYLVSLEIQGIVKKKNS